MTNDAPNEHENFWRLIGVGCLQFISYLNPDDVRVYLGMGMAAVRGRLLNMNFVASTGDYAHRLELATGEWALRRIMPLRPDEGSWVSLEPNLALATHCGSYVLFFGSNYRDRTPIFSNRVMLDSIGPRLRHYKDWLVYLQRRVKKWVAARKSLAFAMALHARLGAASGPAVLGEDLASKICGML